MLRVGLDGPRSAGGHRLADELAGRLALRSRPPLRVCAQDFLRPASLRLEHGRDDPDSFYEDWYDTGALRREVLRPLAAGRPYLPTLRDPGTDRSTRAARRPAPARAVLLLDGPFLLHPELAGDLDLVVHLALNPAARRRRTPVADADRELAAYDRYDAEVGPAVVADLVVRWDDPARPALLSRLSGGGGR